MEIITFEDIRNLNITPLACYQWASEMIANKKATVLPPKTSLNLGEGIFCNIMPCVLSDENIGGVKIVDRYPKRRPSLDSKLLLIDTKTGDFLAFMDANWITAMRTGAVAVHSINLLAKRNFQSIGMIGLGNVARATLLVLASVFPHREFNIKLFKYKGQEDVFSLRFREYGNFHFVYEEELPAVIHGSDVIVSCATYLPEDLCADTCFDPGVLVVPVHTRGFTNCDLFFDKVYADDTNHVCHFKNFDRFKKFAEISDVVTGVAPGRENDEERIIVYNIGLSIHDINYAARVYHLIKSASLTSSVEMYEPKEKFWL